MFQSVCFDSSFEFAAKTMLRGTEASSLCCVEHPLRTAKEAASILFPEADTPIFTILIVVSVLAVLCFSRSVVSAARKGRSQSQ